MTFGASKPAWTSEMMTALLASDDPFRDGQLGTLGKWDFRLAFVRLCHGKVALSGSTKERCKVWSFE